MKKAFVCSIFVCACLFSFSQTFTFSDTQFKTGSYYRTYRIIFSLGKPTFLPECKPLIDSIAAFMLKNPSLKMEIGVHTDSRGSDIANTNLTQARAKSITDYLVYKGIPPERLKATGYGESKLLASDAAIGKAATRDEKEALHRLNRRVELKIIAIN